MKVALYARVSTNEQDSDQQVKPCLELNKWGSDVVICIEYQSAWKDNRDRPEFDKVVKAIKQRQIDHLIVWDLDRIYRNRLKLIEFFKLCKAYGCSIHSVRQTWLEDMQQMPSPWNDIMFDLMLNIMGWLAEEESTKKSDRVKKAVKRESGQTLSYKGKKWGRKGLSENDKKKLHQMLYEQPSASVRTIAGALGLGVGTVHKYLKEFKAEIAKEKDYSAMGQLPNDKKGSGLNSTAFKIFEEVLSKEAPKNEVLPIPKNRIRQPPLFSKSDDDKRGLNSAPL